MKAILIYDLNSDKTRISEEYVEGFNRLHPDYLINLQDKNNKESDNLITLYGIYMFPALIIIREDGQLIKFWQDETLPLYDEVFAYIHQ